MYSPTVVSGNLLINEEYFPWVDQQFRGHYETQVWLAGNGEIYRSYLAPRAKEVKFEPILHANTVVRSIWPKDHVIGKYIEFSYPDGSVIADGSSEPDFDKLQAIRLKQAK